MKIPATIIVVAALLFIMARVVATRDGKPADQPPVAGSPRVIKVRIAHYEFELPADYSVKDTSPRMSDFKLRQIFRNGDTEHPLVLYFGNHPSFPEYKWDTKVVAATDENCARQKYAYSPANRNLEGLIHCDGLKDRDSAFSPYMYIHYFGDDLDPETAKAMQGIIDSMKVVQPKLE